MQTLEAIILTVGERLPEFSELHDCFREVRRRGPAAQPGGKGQGQGQPAGACMLTGVRAHTPHACARDARLCLGACPSLDSRLRGSQAGGELPVGGWLTTCPLPLQELMELIHLHLVKEYIIRLSKRRVVLKTAEQQQQLAVHILANAALIQSFCTENVSPAPCPPTPCLWAPRIPAQPVPARTSVGPRRPSGQGGLPPTRPVLAGVLGGLAAPSPPHARRDHSPARPQCHQDRGGHLCHLLPRLQVRTWAVSVVWQAPPLWPEPGGAAGGPFRADEARMPGMAALTGSLLSACWMLATTHSLVLTATL